jgi:hypothetical protein
MLLHYILLIPIPAVLGSVIIILTRIKALSRTIKEMGYGQIGYWGMWPADRWPDEYYSNFYLGKIKPEYKVKVENWRRRLREVERAYMLSYAIGTMLIALSFVVGFLMIF